jgi:predicted dinucleotide-binding enzyme
MFTSQIRRRTLLAVAASLALGIVTLLDAGESRARPSGAPLKIGIIGTGKIGARSRHWVKAGHEVFVSSRHPEELQDLVKELGPKAHAGTPKEAAAFGSVVLVSIPYGAMPQIGEDLRAELAGKVIIDTSNPNTGATVLRRPNGRRRVRASRPRSCCTARASYARSIAFRPRSLANSGNRQPELAIPVGGDDAAALEIGQRLVRDAGFDPVMVGSLAKTREFDLGQPLAQGNLTAAQLRAKLNP